jgi:hypothetical protein
MSVSDYRINGRPIMEPTTGQWQSRSMVDVQGDNRPIYGPVRAFTLKWQIETYEQWSLLVATFNELQSSGTAVVRLPAYPWDVYPAATGTPYAFREYSGCTLAEPAVGEFFQGYPLDVELLIANIVTS